jgi:hypothetical protein
MRRRIRLRLERRYLLVRAWWKGRELSPVVDRTAVMPDGPILLATVRNEALRLPWFLDYYRKLGVVHFLVVDNGSTDATPDILKAPDISVWRTEASYKAARFGVDWINALLSRYAVGRWVLVADPDELLVYPYCDTRGLPALTRWLETERRDSFGTLLLDMYGRGPVAETRCAPGEDPIAAMPWFDAANYVAERHDFYHNLWVQGGPRLRVYSSDRPREAPALNKTPLVRWRKGYVFCNSTHNLLPRRLNRVYGTRARAFTSGVLLHTKFLSVLTEKAEEELLRREHYDDSREYESYATRGGETVLWTERSERYRGWKQLCDWGLMTRGGWF